MRRAAWCSAAPSVLLRRRRSRMPGRQPHDAPAPRNAGRPLAAVTWVPHSRVTCAAAGDAAGRARSERDQEGAGSPARGLVELQPVADRDVGLEGVDHGTILLDRKVDRAAGLGFVEAGAPQSEDELDPDVAPGVLRARSPSTAISKRVRSTCIFFRMLTTSAPLQVAAAISSVCIGPGAMALSASMGMVGPSGAPPVNRMSPCQVTLTRLMVLFGVMSRES